MIKVRLGTLRELIKEEIASSHSRLRNTPPPIPQSAVKRPEDLIVAYLQSNGEMIDQYDANQALEKLKHKLSKEEYRDISHVIMMHSSGFGHDDLDFDSVKNILSKIRHKTL